MSGPKPKRAASEATRLSNIRRAEHRRRLADADLLRNHMPHNCPDTQRRAQQTLATIEAELTELENLL